MMKSILQLIGGIVAVFIAVSFLVGVYNGYTNAERGRSEKVGNVNALAGTEPKSSDAVVETSPQVKGRDYITTSTALYDDYDANEVATDQKIGNASVVVSGTIRSIDKDFADSAVVHLATRNELEFTGLTLDDSQKPQAGRLHKGQRIVIRCEKMTRVLGSPQGSNCTIISVG